MKLRDEIQGSLEAFLAGVVSLGGDGNLVFDAPMSKKEVKTLSKELVLPPGSHDCFTTISKNIVFEWRLDNEAGAMLGKDFGSCSSGDLAFNPECFETVDETWGAWEDEHWPNKIVFAPDGSGDYLGVVPEGKNKGSVLYLSHDLSPYNGQVIAPSLVDLLTRWSKLGFVGPYFDSFSPFLSKQKKIISPNGPWAKRYLKIIQGNKTQTSLKKAKKDKYDTLFNKIEKIVGAQGASFDRMLMARSKNGTIPKIGKKAAEVIHTIEELFGTQLSEDVQRLVAASNSKSLEDYDDFCGLEPKSMNVGLKEGQDVFIHALRNRHLQRAAFSNTLLFGREKAGSDVYVSIMPSADEVSAVVYRPSQQLPGVTTSLHAYGQLLEVQKVLEKVPWQDWKNKDANRYNRLCAVMAPLLPQTMAFDNKSDRGGNPRDRLLLAFSGHHREKTQADRLFNRANPIFMILRHDAPRSLQLPSSFPKKLIDLSCGDTLYWLWSAYFSAPAKVVHTMCELAKSHPALLVCSAAGLIRKLMKDGDNVLSPLNYLHYARTMYTKGGVHKLANTPNVSQQELMAPDSNDSEYIANSKVDLANAVGVHPPERMGFLWQELAYAYKSEKSWTSLLAVTGMMIREGYFLKSAWDYRAEALVEQKDYQNALVAYDHALMHVDTGLSNALRKKATLLKKMGHQQAAKDHISFLSS